ncbi:4-hydroxybenzoate octaprenyltransferase [Halovibrio salipaludis]|uniref:4-hydroxybenzoate octaprenyltransferase n=1 Tax=Halovibrio salipaludis TaxID=2032626 RepID=A0A2A2FAP3_9GAMM|nr:4-hydroxybenzoate octaprenyltransferase [Halovibrio salipaludis]PAU81804.1 4-hydroxybenzoate octaprenyltransferase [Halovibrio salipaludis]
MTTTRLQPALDRARERLPDFIQLMRINRPIGSLLLLWPTWWALWLAADGIPSLANLVIFTLGVFFMRAAGCVINDFADRNLDGHVKRTRERPLATGRVRPGEAIALFLTLCLVSFLMVVFFTNRLTLWLSFGGVALAFIYPFMKRYTHLPQIVLGAAFSWAIPMAWAAEAGEVTRIAWLLYIANLVWTVAYDTLYAMVDRDDDLKIGIKSTAVLFGDMDRAAVGTLQVTTLLTLLLVGVQTSLGVLFILGVLAMGGLFGYQQWLIQGRERENCFRAFLNNNWAGFAVFLGLALDLALS